MGSVLLPLNSLPHHAASSSSGTLLSQGRTDPRFQELSAGNLRPRRRHNYFIEFRPNLVARVEHLLVPGIYLPL